MPTDNSSVQNMMAQLGQLNSPPVDSAAIFGPAPFDNAMMPPAQNSLSPQPTMTLFQSGNKVPEQDFMKSDFPKMLQKLGVNDKGLAFNQLGKVQLLGRLQGKFGANLKDNTDAMKVLSLFDQAMKTSPDSQQAMNNRGERTLSAILKP